MTKGAAPSPRVPAALATERVCPPAFSVAPFLALIALVTLTTGYVLAVLFRLAGE